MSLISKNAEQNMDSQYILGLSTQILSFLGFLATCIAVIRYLNPSPEYIMFADLVGQARQTWMEYEGQGMLKDDFASVSLELQRLEDGVRDLLFVLSQKSIGSRIRAWTNSFRIKRLSTRAKLFRIGLPLIVQTNKELTEVQRKPANIEDLASLEKMRKSRAEFMCLIESDLSVCPEIPHVELKHEWKLPLGRVDTTLSSNEDTDTLFEPITVPETDLSPQGGELSSSKKRSIVKKLLSGLRKKRRSCSSEYSV